MASNKTEVSVAPTVRTADEMREYFEAHKQELTAFANQESAIKALRDVSKTIAPKVVNTFSKELLRTYLQNIGSNAKNLRNLSRYLFYRCHAYYRWVMYNATMFDLSCRTIVPKYDIIKGGDKKKTLKSFYNTLKVMDEVNFQFEFLKALTIAFREDVFYGCAYYTEGQGLFVLPLDPDYCMISGAYNDGSFSFAMDMSYFKSRQYELEAWGEPFTTMYRQYESQNVKFQEMPAQYSVCLKSRPETWDLEVPIASGLLNSIINLIDIEDVQAVADVSDVYKMVWIELQTLGKDMNDWKIQPEVVVDYFNRMLDEALPDYISAAIVPGKLESINFDQAKADDVNRISKNTATLFNSAGGAQILNSASISGTTAFAAAIQADTELAISNMLPQIQAIINRLLTSWIGDHAKVKFFEVSVYTKQQFKEDLLKGAEYGLPNRLAYNACNQFSELDTLALNFLEVECLQLDKSLVPVQSTHTQSGTDSEGGRPTNETPTDESEKSKEKRDKAKG